MFLFIGTTMDRPVWNKYLNTSHVLIYLPNPHALYFTGADLNTSHVPIYPKC